MKKELRELEKATKAKHTWTRWKKPLRKYLIGKRQIIMAYMDSGFKKSLYPRQTIVISVLGTVPKGLEQLEIGGRPFIVRINQNNEKSHQDSRRVVVTKAPLKPTSKRWCEKLVKSKTLLIIILCKQL